MVRRRAPPRVLTGSPHRNRREFRDGTLVPSLVPALRHDDWAPWCEAMELFAPPAGVCDTLVAASDEWEAANIVKNIERKANREVEAAAEAVGSLSLCLSL
jgi:hypothetical protein